MYRQAFDWDDTRVFLAIVREGSLRAAGRKLGLSQPTVGRRLNSLEAALGGSPLFDRMSGGVRLTEAGATLMPFAERLEEEALALQRQHDLLTSTPASVRISVGEWAGRFLAQCLDRPSTGHRLPGGTTVEFVVSDRTANLTKREADLAVRHGRPEAGDLHVTPVGRIACAVYQGPTLQERGWITYTQEQAHYAVARWIAEHSQARGDAIRVRSSTLDLQLAAARAGSGRAVLPCYVGDVEKDLTRVGDPIAELDAAHWLIVHRDLRRLPHIRFVMDWVHTVFETDVQRLMGR